MKTYKCVEPILHDKPYTIESEIELSDKDAAPLLALGAISGIDQAEKTPAPEGEARTEAIKVAIAGLDKADAALWLKDGKPQSGAISNIVGFVVSAAERDAVWETVKPAVSEPKVNDAEVNGMSAAATTETAA